MIPNSSELKYVDHPAPSIGLMVIHLLTVGALLVAIPTVFEVPTSEQTLLSLLAARTALFLALAILCFYFWPLYSTYYTLSPSGIRVRYGPWSRQYSWSDFTTAYWQRGMFSTRIGWPTMTPCVRLSDGVLLKRTGRRFGLYLTPNDPRAFLRRVGEFAPNLTAEMV